MARPGNGRPCLLKCGRLRPAFDRVADVAASLTGSATATSTSARRSFQASSTPRCGPPPSPTASFPCTVPAGRRRGCYRQTRANVA